METMSIQGGLKEFLRLGEKNERMGNQPAPFGRKVKFLNKNGYDFEKEKARNFFEEGQILTVKEIYVEGFSSEVEFVEFPDRKFNTVMFADI